MIRSLGAAIAAALLIAFPAQGVSGGLEPPYSPPMGAGWKTFRTASTDGSVEYGYEFAFVTREPNGESAAQVVAFRRIVLDKVQRNSSLDAYVRDFALSEKKLEHQVGYVRNLGNGNEHVARFVEVRETGTNGSGFPVVTVRLYAFVKVRSAVYLGRYERNADQPSLSSALASLHSLCLKSSQCSIDNPYFFG